MTLREYFEKNPELLDQFKKCTNEDEFMQVAKENNISFSGNRLKEVYDYVKGGEISEDILEKASGGTGGGDITVNPVGGVGTLII